jgi:transcriptional regulator with XRE-family HTH domain
LTVEDSGLTGSPASGGAGVAAVTAAVAHQVRALRQARGWSLDELSARSAVSKGMVVQVEAARTNPSVGTLCRLAEALGVSVARLLEPPVQQTVRLTVAEQAPLLWRGSAGGFGRLLAGVNDPDLVELWEWRVQPGERHDSAEHAAGTRELLHVLTGELTVTVDGTDHPVRAGETIDFVAEAPHGYRNDGPAPVWLVMVVVLARDDAATPTSPRGRARGAGRRTRAARSSG